MDYNKKKKTNKNKSKRPGFNRKPLSSIGIRNSGNLRPKPLPRAPPKDFGYNTQQKHIPKQEKSHWNGRVEMWTEPQKPRQEKVVKYEVDTDKLLRELAKGNKDALNEITEKLEREIKSEPSEETETQKKTDVAEKSTEDSEASEVSEETEQKEKKQTNESSEQAETDLQNENTKAEQSEDDAQDKEAETQPDDVNESQEMPQDTESEPENSQQEDPLDAPELVYMNPSFWEQLESEMSDELEQIETEEDLEIAPKESEPIEEGY